MHYNVHKHITLSRIWFPIHIVSFLHLFAESFRIDFCRVQLLRIIVSSQVGLLLWWTSFKYSCIAIDITGRLWRASQHGTEHSFKDIHSYMYVYLQVIFALSFHHLCRLALRALTITSKLYRYNFFYKERNAVENFYLKCPANLSRNRFWLCKRLTKEGLPIARSTCRSESLCR